MKITNQHGISVPLAIWLLHDEYDYVNDPHYISATSLLKPLKQLILSQRISKQDREVDLSDMIASSIGSALHDSIEKAWRVSASSGMRKLGYPATVTENLVINPTPEQIAANPKIIPVWFEQRTIREITVGNHTWKIGGKFDTVLQGRLFDNKSTSVWSYIKGGKDDDYRDQGSIYRWLNPELIIDDFIYIQFIFTDWQRREAKANPNYPQTRIKEYPVALRSIQETERFIANKITLLQRYMDEDESLIPECTDEDLWRSDPQYKFYLDPSKASDPHARSTKNFDNIADAQAYQVSKGGKGLIKTVPGEVKACEYCPAFSICQQKELYFAGSI